MTRKRKFDPDLCRQALRETNGDMTTEDVRLMFDQASPHAASVAMTRAGIRLTDSFTWRKA